MPTTTQTFWLKRRVSDSNSPFRFFGEPYSNRETAQAAAECLQGLGYEVLVIRSETSRSSSGSVVREALLDQHLPGLQCR